MGFSSLSPSYAPLRFSKTLEKRSPMNNQPLRNSTKQFVANNIDRVMEQIYNSEIPVAIECQFDQGWEYKFTDHKGNIYIDSKNHYFFFNVVDALVEGILNWMPDSPFSIWFKELISEMEENNE
jgi:hypothetical protein